MEGVYDRVNGSYQAELERTVPELNSMKRQLEDALHEVRLEARITLWPTD